MKNVFAFRYLLALTMMTLSTATWAQTITTPRTPSPAAEVSQTIGISQVTVNYSRPSVNGRAIWGDISQPGVIAPGLTKKSINMTWMGPGFLTLLTDIPNP